MSPERVEVRPPPELQPGDGAGGLLLNGLPMLGSVGSILLVTTMSGGDRARGWLAGGMFLLATLGFIAVQVDRQRRQRRDRVSGSRDDYLRHLDEVRGVLRAAAAAQRDAQVRRQPAPAALPALAAEGSRVWERGRGHPDHLHVRWGLGAAPLALDLADPDGLTAARADPAAARAAHRLVTTHRSVPDVPLALDLRACGRIEVGEPDTARAVVCSAVTFHHPDHLAVAVLADERVLARWDWLKWLPHAHSRRRHDAVGPARLVATTLDDLSPLLGCGTADPAAAPAHLLLVLDGVDPPGVDPDGVTLVDLGRHGAPAGPGVEPDRVDLATAEALARRLAARSTPAAADTGTSTPDLLGLTAGFDPEHGWRPRRADDLLRVPVGSDGAGVPVWLDLKESAQQGMGPHGLVIGATGSGKSELLRTLVLGLAATHGPEQLNLVLVDFKGGATFAPMAGMPHVAAVITNLEHDLTLVDRMQDALAGEMVRRQEVLRAGGHASVRDHERARSSGASLDPLPSLVIVVDEFSELLAAQPELLELFVAIGRLGRSLGLHLLLASQRLDEGRLRGLESHLSYRVALRTFSAGESRSVIGVPDAHTLPAVPGAALLRPDPDTLVRFTAGYVSGPAPDHPAPGPTTDGEPAEVLAWTVAPVDGPSTDGSSSRPAPTAGSATLLERAVTQMRGAGPRARQVWLPPLDVADTLDAVMPDLAVDPELGLVSHRWRAAPGLLVPLGAVDRPREQRRDTLVLDLDGAGGHVVVVGGPRSGKSTALRTLVASLALTHTPRELQVFVVDAAGGALTPLAALPHVAGAATRSEPDVVRRVVAEVEGIVERRETWWRERGIDSIEAYRSRRAEGHDDDGWGEVVLVVDGWATLRADFDDLEARLQQLAARALTFGVHLVASAARWTDLRPALRDVFGSRLELRLGDPLDSEVDRTHASRVPIGRPGRGLLPSGLHVLTALPRLDGDPATASAVDGLLDLVRRVGEGWSGPPGPRLRLLPDRIDVDRVREQAPTSGRDGLLLGLDEAALAPVRLDPSEPHLLVLGDGRSGKTALLRTLVHEIVHTHPPAEAQVVLVDHRRALLGEVPDDHLLHHLASAEQSGPALAELATFLRRRLPGPDVTPSQLRQRSWWSGAEVWVVVDDHDLVATAQSSPLLALQPLLAQAGDVGLHLVVARRTGGIHRAFHEPVLQTLRDLAAPGVLLSGSPDEGPLLGGVRAVPAQPGRARLVTRDRGVEVMQVAWSEPA